ncbi:MAG: alpha/beta hydrolase [Chitinophagaceae bacterium]
MHKLLFFLFFFAGTTAFAGTVDTVSIYSNAMRKNYKAVVIKPDAYNKSKQAYPTVYLLHGYSGAYNNWIMKVPKLKQYADDYGLIIVCPDGAFSSWYFDSPVDTTMKFETYIAKEVPAYIEANYRTIKDRDARAITGLSMGGHGGLFLGFRHANFFSACGSMSGALLIEYITRGYDMQKRLGDTIANRHYYRDLSIMKEMESYPKDSVAIIMDCGVDDFVIEMNRMAHQKMLSLKIPHEYIERPGKHDWPYWANAVQYQLLYFSNHFKKQAFNNRSITKTK